MGGDGSFLCGEGVAVVRRGRTLRAWRDGGSQWAPVSPRLAVARIRFVSERSRKSVNLHVIACYAPTFRAKRSVKDSLSSDLQRAIRDVPGEDKFVLLGDFNARVGSRQSGIADDWQRVRGPHGFGECNESGAELLSFLHMNNATVCNTWFQNKAFHKQSWQHPRTKRSHAIDFIIMHQKDRLLCRDCRVVLNADCGSDHRMVCLTVQLQRMWLSRDKAEPKRRCFAVNLLKPSPASPMATNADVSTPTHVTAYQESVASRLADIPAAASIEERWDAHATSLSTAAETTLGFSACRQPDWFSDQQDVLGPLIEERRLAYNRWIVGGDVIVQSTNSPVSGREEVFATPRTSGWNVPQPKQT